MGSGTDILKLAIQGTAGPEKPAEAGAVALGPGGEERDRARARRGREFVRTLHSLVRLASMYDTNNKSFTAPLDRFAHEIAKLLDERIPVSFDSLDNYLILNGDIIYTDFQTFSAYKAVIEGFQRRKVRGIAFSTPEVEALKQFFHHFARADLTTDAPFEELAARLNSAGVTDVEMFKEGKLISPSDAREASFKVFTESVAFVKDALGKFGTPEERTIKSKHAKRIVQRTVDLVLQDSASLLGLTTLKNHDEYTAIHSVSVAILSILFGLRLGFSKQKLGELGMAGLFHDLGKSEIPLSILNKPGPLDEREWDLMQKHAVYGALSIFKQRSYNSGNLIRIVADYEHHIRHDCAGYPKLTHSRVPSLIGEIIHIADSYDAMTTSRVYQKNPLTPCQAIARLLELSGTSFHPLLIRAFVVTMGAYPPPSLVQLNTKELAIAIRPNPDPRLVYEPEVLVVSGASGRRIEPFAVDLSNQPEGAPRRTIVQALNHYEYGINVHRFLLAHQGLLATEAAGAANAENQGGGEAARPVATG